MILHPVAGYEAVGVPNVAISMFDVDVADDIDVGIFGRWTHIEISTPLLEAKQKKTDAPKPNKDPRHVHLQCPHATPRSRKRLPIAVRLVLRNDTPFGNRAVVLKHRTALATRRRVVEAPVGSVERDLVVWHEIDGLDDIHLTAIGPQDVRSE